MRTKANRRAGEPAPGEAKAPSPLRSAGALHKAMDDGSPMEGELPVGWRVARLDEVVLSSRPSRGGPTDSDSKIPFIPMALLPNDGLLTTRWEMRSTEEVRSGVPFAEGDVLLAKITPCLENGKLGVASGIPGGWGMTSTEVYPLRAERVTTEFLASFLTLPSVRHGLASKLQGATGRQRLPKEALDAFPIPVPPIPEQRAIASVLRTVQGAKEACERVLAATRQLKQSLLHHLFTYGPVPFADAAHIPLKETAVGPTPEHWELSRLGEVATIERGKFTHRPRNDPLFYGGLIPFIQTGDVTKSGGRITAYTQTLNELGLSVSRIFPKGTIVLTIAANIGDTAILTFDSAFPDSLVGITPKRDLVECDYLLCFLQTQKAEMDRLAPRGTQKNINIRFLEPWPVLVPSLPEQRDIAAQLAAVDAKLAAEETRRAALAALFQSLLHYLLTGQVRLPEFAGGKV